MQAKALICDARQSFSLVSVALPDPDDESVSIRTLHSGVSVGTEFALVRGKLSWGPYPICTGYMATGVIERAGAKAGAFKPGDRVYYRDNRRIALPDGTAVSAVSGTHCSHAVVNVRTTHGLAPLPAGADPAVAAMFVLPAVALNGVDQSGVRMGQCALVHGCGPIGLGAVAMLVQRGCRVVAVDLDPVRLAMALALGADAALDARAADHATRLKAEAPEGFDAVFECTGLPACVQPTIALCRRFGHYVWQGNYGRESFPFEFLPAHGRQLTMHFPCDDGLAPSRAAVVKQMALGILPWGRVITHRVPAADAPAFFDAVNRNAVAGLVGAVVDWSGA